MSDAVNHPAHYASSKIEVIEAIEAWGFGPGFCRGNAIKYAARAGKKDPTKEIEDLEKAVWYLNREIEVLKAAKEGRDLTRPNDMNPRATTNDSKTAHSSATAVSTSEAKEATPAFVPPAQALTHFELAGDWAEVNGGEHDGCIVFFPHVTYTELHPLVGKDSVIRFLLEDWSEANKFRCPKCRRMWATAGEQVDSIREKGECIICSAQLTLSTEAAR